MAENTKLEREYVIPLRREYLKVPQYRRAGRAVKAIKKFIAKHMKVAERDTDKVKVDMYLSNELWLRGKTNPPSKIKVKAVKEGEIVRVTFVEMPKRVEFKKAKQERLHKAAAQPAPTATAKEEKKEEKTDEQKTEEKEKEKAVAESSQAAAKQQAKETKHLTKADKAARPQRMALQK